MELWGLTMATITYDSYNSIALSGTSFDFAAQAGGEPVGELTSEDNLTVTISIPENVITEPSFRFSGDDFTAYEGVVYEDFDTTTNSGKAVGVYDNATGKIEVKRQDAGVDYFSFVMRPYIVDNYLTEGVLVEEITFRTSLTNINPTSLQIRGDQYTVTTSLEQEEGGGTISVERVNLASKEPFTATVDSETGNIIGLQGSFDAATGTVTIKAGSGKFIEPGSIRYDAVSESRLPMDNELMGINPVRLPASGRVPVINRGGTLVIFHEQSQAITPTAGATVDCGRDDVALMEVLDTNGFRLDHNQFSLDRAAGTITFEDPLILQTVQGDALTPPYTLVDRIENMRVANDVDITGRVTVAVPPDRAFPAGSMVADAIVFGDTFARVYNEFHQESWNSGAPVWSDERIGDDTTAKYDLINYPIEIVNYGSTTERWAIRFINSTTVQVIGEKYGIVLDNHSISVDGDIAPLNPANGQPYFTINADGFGSGWVTNNVLRFNTEGAQGQQWLIRSVQPGAATEVKDSIEIETRGDAN